MLNADSKVLDLLLASGNCGPIGIRRSSEPLVIEDDYQPTLEIELSLNVSYFPDGIGKKYIFRKANYVKLSTL